MSKRRLLIDENQLPIVSEVITDATIGTNITPTQNTKYLYSFSEQIDRSSPVGTFYTIEMQAVAVWQNAVINTNVAIVFAAAGIGITSQLPIAPTSTSFPVKVLAKFVVSRFSDKWKITHSIVCGGFNSDARISTGEVDSVIFYGLTGISFGLGTPNNTFTSGDYLRFENIYLRKN